MDDVPKRHCLLLQIHEQRNREELDQRFQDVMQKHRERIQVWAGFRQSTTWGWVNRVEGGPTTQH